MTRHRDPHASIAFRPATVTDRTEEAIRAKAAAEGISLSLSYRPQMRSVRPSSAAVGRNAAGMPAPNRKAR